MANKGGGQVVSWSWIPIALFISVGMGICIIALVSVGNAKEENFFGKDWKQMNKVLNAMIDIEDKYSFTKEEQESFDMAVLCVSHEMNKLRYKK